MIFVFCDTVFLFACLNTNSCDRRIHFRFRWPRSKSSDLCQTFYSSSSVNYCHLLQVLDCGIRSENVIDGIEVGILENCE